MLHLRKLNLSQATYKKALQGNKVALDKVRLATQKLIKTGKVNNKAVKGFQVTHHRNAMSLSRLRSQLLMAAFAYNTLLRPVMNIITASAIQEKAERSVAAALKSTAGASNMTQGEIVRHAAAIEELTGVGDELVLGSSALLLTFTNIGRNVFPEAQTAIVNIASAMNLGVVSSESLKSATILVGKALNDPIKGLSALTRVGIQFTEQQKDQIKSFSDLGQSQEAQEVILKELTTQYGDFAEAIRNTHEGRMQALQSALGTLAEEMGKVLVPALSSAVEMLISFTKALSGGSARKVAKFVTIIGAMVAIYKAIHLAQKATIALGKKEITILAIKKALMGDWKALAGAAIAGVATTIALNINNQEELNGLSKEELDLIEKKKQAEALARGEKLKGSLEELEAAQKSIEGLEKRLFLINANSEVDKYRINQGRTLLDQEIELLEEIEKQTTAKKLAKDIETSEASLFKKLELSASMSEVERFRIEQGRELSDLEIQYLESLEAINIATEEALEKEKRLIQLKKEKVYQEKLALSVSASLEQMGQTIAALELKKADASQLEIGRAINLIEKNKIMEKHQAEILAIDAKMDGLTGDKLNKQIKILEDKQEEVDLIHKIFQLKDDMLVQDEQAIANEKEKSRQQEIQGLKMQLASEAFSLMNESIAREKELLDTKMNDDIERIKQTSLYKIAAARNDTKAMERLEEQARKKTLAKRKKNFRNKQLVAASEVLLNTGIAISKALATYVWPASMPIVTLMTALGGMQLASIASQKGPTYARGGDFVTSGKQTITVGDNPGGRERVQVTPLSSPNFNGPKAGSNVNITFTGNVMSQDFIENEAIPQIKEAIRRGADIGVS